jgi:hypothetical protein
MKYALIAAVALCSGATSTTQAWAGDQGKACIVKVLHSEELPYAWMGSWQVKVTVEVTPPGGAAFVTTLQNDVTWQKSAARRGERFNVRCDPVNSLIYW